MNVLQQNFLRLDTFSYCISPVIIIFLFRIVSVIFAKQEEEEV